MECLLWWFLYSSFWIRLATPILDPDHLISLKKTKNSQISIKKMQRSLKTLPMLYNVFLNIFIIWADDQALWIGVIGMNWSDKRNGASM